MQQNKYLELKDGMVLKVMPFNKKKFFYGKHYIYSHCDKHLYINDISLKYLFKNKKYSIYNNKYSLVKYNNEIFIIKMPIYIINNVFTETINYNNSVYELHIKKSYNNPVFKYSPSYTNSYINIIQCDPLDIFDFYNSDEYNNLMNEFINIKHKLASKDFKLIDDLIKMKILNKNDYKYIYRKQTILKLKTKIDG